jgi:hypothetical protein
MKVKQTHMNNTHLLEIWEIIIHVNKPGIFHVNITLHVLWTNNKLVVGKHDTYRH